MHIYIFKRIIQAVPVLLIVATITFFLIRVAPGGPFSADKNVTPEILENLNAYYGLNKPVYVQYFDYLFSLMKGDLGPSFQYSNRTVNELIADAFPVSLKLGAAAMVFALFIGCFLGVTASIKSNTLTDYSAMSLAMIGICIPSFVIGPILIWVFAIKFSLFNVAGLHSFDDYILPVITLGALYAANIARLCRGGMLEILSQDFVKTAKAKGISKTNIIMKHCLKGGLMPVVSYFGPAVAGVITGSFVVESIFQIPGLGRLFVFSAFNRDYTMIMGVVLFYALLNIICNLAADIVLILIDPRRSFKE